MPVFERFRSEAHSPSGASAGSMPALRRSPKVLPSGPSIAATFSSASRIFSTLSLSSFLSSSSVRAEP